MDIEQLLLEKAIMDSQSGPPSMAEAAGGGALLGTSLGVLGRGAIETKNYNYVPPAPRDAASSTPINDISLGKIKSELLARSQNAAARVKSFAGPSRRMATTGLLGAAVGGALGPGTANMLFRGMPNEAADFLAKVQTSPDGLTEMDQMKLRELLRDIYSGK